MEGVYVLRNENLQIHFFFLVFGVTENLNVLNLDKKNDDSYGVVCMTKKEGLEIGTNDVIF